MSDNELLARVSLEIAAANSFRISWKEADAYAEFIINLVRKNT